jgi:hypothetical protein
VTGGGLSPDGTQWVRARRRFLFPVRVMGTLFRGKMLAALEHASASGLIDLGGIDRQALRRKAWIVYAKRPFGGPEQVIRYLGRYTHRVGISNQRLVSMDERGVTFRTKDGKSVTITPVDMLARFVEHVLPPGFVKIRHFGLHAASHATTKLELARRRLDPAAPPRPRIDDVPDTPELLLRLMGIDLRLCPACNAPAVVRTALPEPEMRSRAPPRVK